MILSNEKQRDSERKQKNSITRGIRIFSTDEKNTEYLAEPGQYKHIKTKANTRVILDRGKRRARKKKNKNKITVLHETKRESQYRQNNTQSLTKSRQYKQQNKNKYTCNTG